MYKYSLFTSDIAQHWKMFDKKAVGCNIIKNHFKMKHLIFCLLFITLLFFSLNSCKNEISDHPVQELNADTKEGYGWNIDLTIFMPEFSDSCQITARWRKGTILRLNDTISFGVVERNSHLSWEYLEPGITIEDNIIKIYKAIIRSFNQVHRSSSF
jgi:hypothetical protein